MPAKNSYLTVKDMFCGAGGSSQGVRNCSNKRGGGIEVKMAMNHWELAIESHNTNFPDTSHACVNVSDSDPRRFPSTDILVGSPECTTYSPGGGSKHAKLKATLDLFDQSPLNPATQKSRVTMWDIPRYAEYHNYNIVIIENVMEAKRDWPLFEVWLKAMHVLGYNHKIKYLNSMHFWPTPQSRDRMYVVFWKKGNKAPKLDYTPLAYCPCCSKDVKAVQNWKNPEKKFGKYRSQYVYVCPKDGMVLEPYYYASFNAINWTDIGTKIGERKRPLKPNTTRRIQYGLDKFADDPLILNVNNIFPAPFVAKGEHTSLTKGYVKKVDDVFQTQTVRQTSSLITPWIIEMNKTGECKPASEPTATITADGINHAILGSPLVVENKGQSNSKQVTKPFGAVTTKVHHGIVTDEAMKSFLSYYNGTSQASGINEPMGTVTTKERLSLVSYEKPRIEDCYYRMIKAPEVKASMAFDKDYVILGNSKEQVKQCGNAVTPPVMEWLINQCVESLE